MNIWLVVMHNESLQVDFPHCLLVITIIRTMAIMWWKLKYYTVHGKRLSMESKVHIAMPA